MTESPAAFLAGLVLGTAVIISACLVLRGGPLPAPEPAPAKATAAAALTQAAGLEVCWLEPAVRLDGQALRLASSPESDRAVAEALAAGRFELVLAQSGSATR